MNRQQINYFHAYRYLHLYQTTKSS